MKNYVLYAVDIIETETTDKKAAWHMQRRLNEAVSHEVALDLLSLARTLLQCEPGHDPSLYPKRKQ